ncbi:Asx homology domain-containing protein [Xylaria sp. FL1777]|nr:Asx homology domain-containing protein [Xylaria sp. FL1777]
MMKLGRFRDKDTTPSNADSSPDELDTPARTRHTKQPASNNEVVLDEIVVSGPPQSTSTKGVDLKSEPTIRTNSAETPRVLRRSNRASSISQRGSPAASPLDRSVTMKKQEFGIGISGNDDGKPDELALPPTSKKRKVDPPTPTPRVSFRKSRSKWDNPDEMLTDPNSPLVKAKLRELLCSPMAWDVLSREEKEQILSKFPDNTMILEPDTPNARPDVAALLNNNNFRNDVTRYQGGLSKGFHDPEWIRQAQSAHRSREAGVYDDFMAADFKEKWGIPMPEQSQPRLQTSENDSHEVDNTLEGQANSTSLERNTAAPSEDAADKDQGVNNTGKAQLTDISHAESIEVSTEHPNGNMEDPNGSRSASTDNGSSAEEIKDQPPRSDGKEGGLVPAEVVTTSNSTESDSQRPENKNLDAEMSGVPPPPDVMEGVEHQGKEKQPDITETKQADAGNAEQLTGESSQVIVQE